MTVKTRPCTGSEPSDGGWPLDWSLLLRCFLPIDSILQSTRHLGNCVALAKRVTTGRCWTRCADLPMRAPNCRQGALGSEGGRRLLQELHCNMMMNLHLSI